jgi:hypothetical protein
MNYQQMIEQATRIKTIYEKKLLKLANVVGIGVGFKEKEGQLTDQIAIIVNVTEKKPLTELSAQDVIPPELDGVITDVQEVGQIKAL